MRRVVQFVVDHEGCSIDAIRNHFAETALQDVENLVIQTHEAGLIDAQLTYTRMMDGDSPNFGYIRSTPEGRAWLERTRCCFAL